MTPATLVAALAAGIVAETPRGAADQSLWPITDSRHSPRLDPAGAFLILAQTAPVAWRRSHPVLAWFEHRHAAAHLRDRLWAEHGLGGVPPLPHPGGVRRDGRQRPGRVARASADGAHRHLGRRPHRDRLPRLHGGRVPVHQAGGPGHGPGRAARRDRGPHASRPGDDEAAGTVELVGSGPAPALPRAVGRVGGVASAGGGASLARSRDRCVHPLFRGCGRPPPPASGSRARSPGRGRFHGGRGRR
jgi:hypothetical protein